MQGVCVVAIVAMFLAVMSKTPGGGHGLGTEYPPSEVILYIDPPPVAGLFFPPMPDRNPKR